MRAICVNADHNKNKLMQKMGKFSMDATFDLSIVEISGITDGSRYYSSILYFSFFFITFLYDGETNRYIWSFKLSRNSHTFKNDFILSIAVRL